MTAISPRSVLIEDDGGEVYKSDDQDVYQQQVNDYIK
jgi:hypothetical protein